MSINSISSGQTYQAFQQLSAQKKTSASKASDSSQVEQVPQASRKTKFSHLLETEKQYFKDMMTTSLLHARGMQWAMSQSLYSVSDALGTQKAYDSSGDGVLRQGELNNNLSLASQQIKAYQQQQQGSVSSVEQERRLGLATNYNIGQSLQSNFDNIAKLDGKQGLSQGDIRALGGLDGNAQSISGFDFMAATNKANYQEFQNRLSWLESWAASSGIYA